MKIILGIIKKIRKLFYLLVCLLVIIFVGDPIFFKTFAMDNYQTDLVTEELRLKVPADLKEVRLEAEKNVWEPWLSNQDGFLERQIYWDQEKEEALILVDWKNKKLWKNISEEDVNKLQEKFEDNVKTSLNLKNNPFKLIYEGELR